jgi:hypothetical protein
MPAPSRYTSPAYGGIREAQRQRRQRQEFRALNDPDPLRRQNAASMLGVDLPEQRAAELYQRDEQRSMQAEARAFDKAQAAAERERAASIKEQQREAARQQKAQAKQVFNEEKNRREAQYVAEKRPTYIDADGMIQPKQSDEQWAGVKRSESAARKATEDLAVQKRGIDATEKAISEVDSQFTLRGRELRAAAAAMRRAAAQAKKELAPNADALQAEARAAQQAADDASLQELEWERNKLANKSVVQGAETLNAAGKAQVKDLKEGRLPADTNLVQSPELPKPAPDVPGTADTANERVIGADGQPIARPAPGIGDLRAAKGAEMPPPTLEQQFQTHQAELDRFTTAKQAASKPFDDVVAKIQARGVAEPLIQLPDGTMGFAPGVTDEEKQMLKLAHQAVQKHQPALETQAREIDARGAELQARAQEEAARFKAERDAEMARMRSTPGMAPVADQITKLDADFESVVSKLDPQSSEEDAVALQAITERYQQEREAALKSGQENQQKMREALNAARLQVTEETKAEIDALASGPDYGSMSADASGADFYKDLQSRNQARLAEEGKKFGLTPEQTQNLVADLQKETEWTGVGVKDDPARVLSTGAVVVNPKLWIDPAKFKDAVEATNAAPEAKARALEIMPELEKQALTALLPGISSAPGFREFALKNGADFMNPKVVNLANWTPEEIEAARAKSKFKTPDELVKAYRESAEGNRWWANNAQQAVLGLASGTLGMAQQAAGSYAAITGNKGAADLALDASKVMQQSGAASAAMTSGQWTNKLAQGATSIVPALASGILVRGLGAAAGAKNGTALAQQLGLGGSAGAAAAQSFGGTWTEAYDANRKQGMSHEEARAQALVPAIASGLATAAITYGFGATGTESAFAADQFRKTGKEMLKALAKGSGQEFTEEALDQAMQGVIASLTYNPGKPIGETIMEALEAGVIGGVLGGGMTAITNAGAPPPNPLQQTADLAASDAEIARIEQADPALAAQAETIREIASGTPLDQMTDAQLESVGVTRNPKGEVVNVKPKQGEPAPAVKIENGQPIITQPALDILEQQAPRTRSLVQLDETEARQRISQQQTEQSPPTDAETPSAEVASEPRGSSTEAVAVPADSGAGLEAEGAAEASLAEAAPATEVEPPTPGAIAPTVPGDPGATVGPAPRDPGSWSASKTSTGGVVFRPGDAPATTESQPEQPAQPPERQVMEIAAPLVLGVERASGKNKAAGLAGRAKLLSEVIKQTAKNFTNIRFITTEPNSSPASLAEDGAMELDVAAVLTAMTAKSPKEARAWLESMVDEEFKHRVALDLERTSPEFAQDLAELYAALPDGVKEMSRAAYFAQIDKPGQKNQFPDEFNARHEFFRQYWQSAKLQKATEAALAQKGMLAKLRSLIAQFLKELRRIQKGAANPQVKAIADRLIAQAEAKAAELKGKISETSKQGDAGDVPQKEPSTPRRDQSPAVQEKPARLEELAQQTKNPALAETLRKKAERLRAKESAEATQSPNDTPQTPQEGSLPQQPEVSPVEKPDEAVGEVQQPVRAADPTREGREGADRGGELTRWDDAAQKRFASFRRKLKQAQTKKDWPAALKVAEDAVSYYETAPEGPPDQLADFERAIEDARAQIARAPSLSDAVKDKARDAFKGLFAPPTGATPDEITQRGLPPEKLPAFIDLAATLVKEGVTTPKQLGAFLDDVFPGGQARPFSQALWDALGMVSPDLRGTHDWNAIYPPDSAPAPDAEPVTAKEQDELRELEITKQAREIAQSGDEPDDVFRALVELYNNQPILKEKTSGSKIRQAYSTPAPLAYAASVIGDVSGGEIVAEPTAGHGMLLMEADPSKQIVLVNELDPARRERMQSIPGFKEQGFILTGKDATTWETGPKPDRVIANPPFGTIMAENGLPTLFQTPYGNTTNIDHAIVAQSLKTMLPDGRAIFIIGGPAPTARSDKARASSYGGGARGAFFKWLYDNNRVVDHFTVDGKLYERQGAGWPVDVILVQGAGKSPITLPTLKAPRMITSWEELQNELSRSDEDRIAAGRYSAEELGARVGDMADALGGLSRPTGSPAESSSVQSSATVIPGPRQDSRSDAESGKRGVEQTAGEPAQNAGASDRGRATSEPEGSGQRPAAGVGSGDAVPRSTRKQPVEDESGNTFQVDYTPASGVNPGGFLAPVNLSGPMNAALSRLKVKVGDLTKYVTEKLGYSKGEDISKYYFGDQIDALALAVHNFESGGALIVGDQTGTGKGRIAAGLMRYAVKSGYKPIFVTKKQDLYKAMIEDLADTGSADLVIPVITDNKVSPEVREATPHQLLSGKEVFDRITSSGGELPAGATAIFTTYSQIQGDDQPGLTKSERATAKSGGQAPADYWRMAALRSIAHEAVLIMDESHLASGASTTGFRFAELLGRIRLAYYSSATFAKRPDSMGIYFKTRLGQVAGGNMEGVIDLMDAGGVPAMQVASSMLAEDGQYLRRERSFDGVTFSTHINSETLERDTRIADSYTQGLREIVMVQSRMSDAAEAINNLLAAIGKRYSIPASGRSRLESANFSAKLHNLVRQYILAVKAKGIAEMAIHAIQKGVKNKAGEVTRRKVVVAVENTMESVIEDLALSEYPTTFKGALLNYLSQMRTFKSGGGYGRPATEIRISDEPNPEFKDVQDRELRDRAVLLSTNDAGERIATINEPVVQEMVRRAMMQVFRAAEESISKLDLGDMPLSPIDHMRQVVGKAGIKTGEITGRSMGLDEDGSPYTRSPREIKASLTTMDQFNNGDLDFIILNQSGSTGISLHASKKFKNKTPRLMIVGQASLDINEFMQMLGRVHRSGQVEFPDYVLYQTALPAEKRPAAILGRKMAMLNANTTSNADSEVSKSESADLFNEYGDEVVHTYLSRHPSLTEEIALSWPKLTDDDGRLKPLNDFIADENGGEGYLSRSVTGHLAILPVEEQEAFWELVSADYAAKIAYLDQIGQNKLKAASMDIRAKTTSRTMLSSGSGDPESVFGQPAYLETVEARLGREPLGADAAVELAREKESGAKTRQSQYVQDSDRFIEELEREKAAKTLIGWSKKRDAWLTNQKEQRDQIASAIGMIGKIGTYKRDDGKTGYALVDSVSLDEKALTTPSKQMFIVYVNDSRYRLTIPASQIGSFFTPSTYGQRDGWERSWEFSNTRSIVTGNLLLGLEALGGQGKIINFTTDSGETKMGILLPASFTRTEAATDSARTPVTSAKQAREALADDRKISNAANTVKIEVSKDGDITLTVPSSRSEGGKYWRDPALNRFMQGGEFVQRGGWMIGVVPPASFGDVWDRLTGMGENFKSSPPPQNLQAPPTGDESDDEIIKLLTEQLSDELPSEEELRALQEFHNLEVPGEYTIGDPEIANPGQTEAQRKAFDVIREVYADTILKKQSAEDLDKAARKRATEDPKGVQRAILEAYSRGEPVSNLDTRAATHLYRDLSREAIISGDAAKLREASVFALAYIGTGTEQGRALAARRDTTKTKQERFDEFIAEALSQPQKIEDRLAFEEAPSAADKSRAIARLNREIAEAQAAKKSAEVQSKARQREVEKKRPTKEDLALKFAKEQRDAMKKALSKEGLTLEDVLEGRVSYRVKFGRLVMDAMGQKDAQREKAIDLIVHGWSTTEISRATKMSTDTIAKLRDELRNRPRALVEAIKDMLRRGIKVTDIAANLSAPPTGPSMSDAELEAEAVRILDLLIPTEQQADRSRWKKVRRTRPVSDKSPDAALERAILRLEKVTGPRSRPSEMQALIRRHRSKRVSDFVFQAVQLGAEPELAREADAAIEKSRKPARPVVEVDLDWEYVPFDLNDNAQAYRVMRTMSESTKGAFDMVTEFWINSILSGPQTHAVNIVGNAASTLWDMTFQRVGEMATGSALRLTGKSEAAKNTASIGEIAPMIKGILPGITRGWTMAAEAWSTEKDLFDQTYLNTPEDVEDELDRHGPTGAIKGKAGRVIRIPGRALRAVDSFFKSVISHIEVGAQAYRLGKSKGLSGDALQEFIRMETEMPGSMSWVMAVDKAKELTFQDESTATMMAEGITRAPGRASKALEGKALSEARKGNQRKARNLIAAAKAMSFVQNVMRFIFPFVRTPTNIIRMGLRKSPVGSVALAFHLLKGIRAGVKGQGFFNKYPAALLARHLTEQSFAWTGMALLMALSEGDDDDDKKRVLLVGGRPYSQGAGTSEADQANRLYGGTYMLIIRDAEGKTQARVMFGRIEPFATALGGMVDAARAMKMHWRKGNAEEANRIKKAIASNLLGQMEDKTFMRGIGDVTRAFADLTDPDSKGGAFNRYGENILAGFVPNIIKQPLRNIDPVQRNYKQADAVETGILSLNKHTFWPDGRYANPMVDIFGRDVEKSGNPLFRVFWPTPNKVTPEATNQMLESWNREHPVNIPGEDNKKESRYLPLRADSRYYKVKDGGKERPMTRPEMRVYDKAAGETFRRAQSNLAPETVAKPQFPDIATLKKNLSSARKSAKAGIGSPPPSPTPSASWNDNPMERLKAMQKANALR